MTILRTLRGLPPLVLALLATVDLSCDDQPVKNSPIGQILGNVWIPRDSVNGCDRLSEFLQ